MNNYLLLARRRSEGKEISLFLIENKNKGANPMPGNTRILGVMCSDSLMGKNLGKMARRSSP